MAGFFKSASTLGLCVQCNVACDSCTSLTSCTACKASDNTREDETLGCVCKAGFYEDGNLICPKCNLECATCAESAEKCTSCDTVGNFMMNTEGTSCICQVGYYLLLTDTSATCAQCDSSCEQCIESALKCT